VTETLTVRSERRETVKQVKEVNARDRQRETETDR
jgi:hypothetical protein